MSWQPVCFARLPSRSRRGDPPPQSRRRFDCAKWLNERYLPLRLSNHSGHLLLAVSHLLSQLALLTVPHPSRRPASLFSPGALTRFDNYGKIRAREHLHGEHLRFDAVGSRAAAFFQLSTRPTTDRSPRVLCCDRVDLEEISNAAVNSTLSGDRKRF